MRTTIAFIIIAAFAVTGCQPAEPPAAETTPAMPAQSLGVESTATPNVSETPPHILRALSSPERSEEQRARDVHRKPAEILTLSGIQEGAQIIEIAGFGQYFTAMLAEAVGPSGMIDVYDLPYTEQFAGEASRAFDAAHDNVAYHQENYNDVTFPQNVDAVFNVLYYHDLQPQGIDTAAMNTKLYNALKVGGIYLIIDHKAEDGSAWRDAATIHRMGVETIKEEVMAAGFELALESDLLANPADDRTQMVFAPGTRGTTDQAFFIFRKPN